MQLPYTAIVSLFPDLIGRFEHNIDLRLNAFLSDIAHTDAIVIRSSRSFRPAKAQTAQSFIERVQGLAGTTLQTFDEVPLARCALVRQRGGGNRGLRND
jgi:hypothetical protein